MSTALNANAAANNGSILSSLWSGVKWLGQSFGVVIMIAFGIVIALLAVLWAGVKWVHSHVGQMKRTMVAMMVAVVSAFYYSYLYGQEFSAFFAGPMAATFGCLLLYTVIRFGHTKLDVIEQLKQGNHAIAEYFKSYALIIGLCLAAALFASVL